MYLLDFGKVCSMRIIYQKRNLFKTTNLVSLLSVNPPHEAKSNYGKMVLA